MTVAIVLGRKIRIDDLARTLRLAQATMPQETMPDEPVLAGEGSLWPGGERWGGGHSKVYKVTMPEGHAVFAKHLGQTDPREAFASHAASHILRHLGFENVPLDHPHKDKDGHWWNLSEAIEDAKPISEVFHSGDPKKHQERILRRNSKEELGKLLTAEWLVNRADPHELNTLVGRYGDIHPIDLGMSIHPLDMREYAQRDDITPTKLRHPWNANHHAVIGYGLVSPNQPLDKDFLKHLLHNEADLRDQLEGHLLDHPEPAPTEWVTPAKVRFARKFQQISGLLDKKSPIIADLPYDAPLRPYHKRGVRPHAAWFVQS